MRSGLCVPISWIGPCSLQASSLVIMTDACLPTIGHDQLFDGHAFRPSAIFVLPCAEWNVPGARNDRAEPNWHLCTPQGKYLCVSIGL